MRSRCQNVSALLARARPNPHTPPFQRPRAPSDLFFFAYNATPALVMQPGVTTANGWELDQVWEVWAPDSTYPGSSADEGDRNMQLTFLSYPGCYSRLGPMSIVEESKEPCR
jgi:hypothetical protein